MTLADKMNTWRALKDQTDALEQEIAEEVKALGKTQKIDGVTCSYSGGRKSYDYEGACRDLPQEVLDAYTTVIPEQRKVDYSALCKGEDIKAPVLSQTSPTAKLKITAPKITAATPFPQG
jgi:hypothetical protein